MLERKLTQINDMNFGQGINDFLSKQAAIIQKVKTKLMLMQNEWFLDKNRGFPWIDILGQKNIDQLLLESLLKSYILEIEGIKTMTSFQSVLDNKTRSCKIIVNIKTIYQEEIESISFDFFNKNKIKN